MKITRAARTIEVSTTNREITAHGGAVLLRAAAQAVGLGRAIAKHLRLKKRARGLSEAEFVLGMAEAIALGASCLDDLAVARADLAQERLRGFAIPAPQTAGAFLMRFTLGHINQLDQALRAVQRRALELLGVRAGTTVTLDFDSTYIRLTSSRRQGADRTYLKRYALHPLLCFVAEFGTCLHAKLRRGSANSSRGIEGFVREALKRIPDGARVRARFDFGFYSSDLFQRLEDQGVTYLCGASLYPRLTSVIRQIPDHCWMPCQDKDEGEVAEFGYRITNDPDHKFRRYIAKRIPVRPGEQTEIETLGYHYWVLVTNDHESDPVSLEREHRHKAQIESGVRELKENFGLEVLRKHGFMANWAWLLIVTAAHNLNRFTQLLGGLGDDGDLRAKRLRYRYLQVPALLVTSARSLVLKLRRDYPLFDRFIAALTRLQSVPLPAV